MQPFHEVLNTPDIRAKLELLDANCHLVLENPARFTVPEVPARDVAVVRVRELPPRPGLATAEGQARLLGDLASIELQAMEMGLRTLIEFPAAPPEFRRELAAVTRDEGLHLRLCLDAMEGLGFPWGRWPVHLGLWSCLSRDDSLLDRVLIVHRYLEGSGLDAGQNILKKLKGVKAPGLTAVTERIARDEIGHVQFGTRWYRALCEREGLDAGADFPARMRRLEGRLPRRLEPLDRPVRRLAGFSDSELNSIEALQARWRGR